MSDHHRTGPTRTDEAADHGNRALLAGLQGGRARVHAASVSDREIRISDRDAADREWHGAGVGQR